MNVIVWNCRGALKPSFQSHVQELVRIHNPAILVIMETRIGGDRARQITDRLPFENAFHTETIGYTNGLWMLWNSERVDITLVSSTKQEIHATVNVPNSHSNWLFFAIYASPRSAKRRILCNNLIKVSELHNLPWVMAGDFNEPLTEEDQFEGRAVSVNRSLLFKECLDKCSMIDIGFTGARFTWTNKRPIQSLIQEQIDRFFVNPSWCLLYPKAKVLHLTSAIQITVSYCLKLNQESMWEERGFLDSNLVGCLIPPSQGLFLRLDSAQRLRKPLKFAQRMQRSGIDCSLGIFFRKRKVL